ncbi:MAG: hypothetical protein ACAI38_02375 [Myxococcota bacterium]
MALPETQPLRAGVSSSGALQGPSTPATRSSVALDLSAGFTTGEHGSARLLLRDRDWDRHRHYDRNDRWPGPHRPGPYRPYPPPYYPPRPYPVPIPIPGYPSPLPGPLPGERACYPWEAGSWGSRQDVFGRWWCRW